MASDVVQQAWAAWCRLKQGSKSWSDWVQVGHALLEGRTTALRNAGTTSPAGRGYSDAFSDWLTYNRFDVGPSHRAKLLVVMGILPEIEQWLATLTPLQRSRMNHPGTVLLNYRKATRIGPALESVNPTHSVTPGAAVQVDIPRQSRGLRNGAAQSGRSRSETPSMWPRMKHSL